MENGKWKIKTVLKFSIFHFPLFWRIDVKGAKIFGFFAFFESLRLFIRTIHCRAHSCQTTNHHGYGALETWFGVSFLSRRRLRERRRRRQLVLLLVGRLIVIQVFLLRVLPRCEWRLRWVRRRLNCFRQSFARSFLFPRRR